MDIEKLREEDRLMRQLADIHNRENPGHNCLVYGNFINCTCGFHSHLSGHGYMIQHNDNYTVVNHLYPDRIERMGY